MVDYDITLYSYGVKNYECNVHLGGYLKKLMENILATKWSFLMYDLLFRMNRARKKVLSFGLLKFDEGKVEEYKKNIEVYLEMGILKIRKLGHHFIRNRKQFH